MGLLSRVKQWVTGEILSASDLNAEFDNIIAGIIQGTTAVEGMWRSATQTEARAGASTTRVLTPAGLSSIGAAAGDVLYFDGTKFAPLTIGTPGHVLTVNGGGTAPGWAASGGGATFAAGTKLWFYQDTAPTGWTIDASCADGLLAVKGGTGSYNVAGGNRAGAWAMTAEQMPTHSHSATAANESAHVHADSSATNSVAVASGTGAFAPMYWDPTDTNSANTNAGSAHTHVVSIGNAGSGEATYRPVANVGIVATKDA